MTLPDVPDSDAVGGVGPGVGDVAPDFELDGTGGGSYRLADYRGQPVLLVFYPADFTPVCTAQLSSYGGDLAEFRQTGAQILAISPQTVDSHEAFAASLGGLDFPLLADAGKDVGRRYGILGPLGSYRRSVFVVDPGGVIRYAHRSAAGRTYRPTEELVAALRDAS